MLRYISNFLNEKQFQVKVSNSLSELYIQKNGVPRGSSLAVTIFLLAINDIVETIETHVTANLFADDFNILCRSKNIKTVQHFFQKSANNLSNWSNYTGFTFSTQKS